MKMEKTKKNKGISIKKILESPYSIIVVLILLVVSLLAYSRFLIKANILYSFSGYTEEFSFYDGTIYVGSLVNHFGDSKVSYTGKDVTLYEFEVGYYIKKGEKYTPISTTDGYEIEEKNKKGVSLKDLLASTSFSFTEMHKNAVFLSHENIGNIENLVFKVTGQNKKGEKIEIEIPMIVEKITK